MPLGGKGERLVERAATMGAGPVQAGHQRGGLAAGVAPEQLDDRRGAANLVHVRNCNDAVARESLPHNLQTRGPIRKRPGGFRRSGLNELEAYDRELVGRLRELLGTNLVGVYLTGSRVLGAYLPGRSDVDVMAVSRSDPGSERKQAILERVRHEALPCPARGLELVLYTENGVRTPSAEAGFVLNLNTGRDMPLHVSVDSAAEPGFWFVIDRSIAREHGVALFGPPAPELFAPIPRVAIVHALEEGHRWHRESGEARLDDVVLNACRGWRFVEQGVWSSKPDAGEWARRRLEDPRVVEAALARRQPDGGAELHQREVDAFLDFVAGRVGWA
jgi:predicted nucleotidyltransferase